jgi:hypothetical protein
MIKTIDVKAFFLVSIAVLFLSACAGVSSQNQPGVPATYVPTHEVVLITPVVGTSVSSSSKNLSSITPQTTPSGPSTIVPGTSGEGGTIITMDDNGDTLVLQPGQRFSLMLDEAYTWDINITDTSVVNRVTGVMPIIGSQGIFEALQAGQTQLNASGDPLCRSETPACMRPSVIFEMKITVK